eukprot:g4490.t1
MSAAACGRPERLSAAALSVPLVQTTVAGFLPDRDLGRSTMYSRAWQSTVAGARRLWRARMLQRWPLARAAPCGSAASLPSPAEDPHAVFVARAEAECRGRDLIGLLVDGDKDGMCSPLQWSRAFRQLVDLRSVAPFLWERHARCTTEIGAEWTLLRAAWTASFQDASARIGALLSSETAESAPMEEFLIALSGFMDTKLSGPDGHQLLVSELDLIAEEVASYLKARVADEADGAPRRNRIGPRRRSPREVMHDVCDFLFRGSQGASLQFGVFRGATQTYYEPCNSSLHDCLKTRVGLPITLSVILVAVCRRLGIEHVHGVGAPGHFVCKYYVPKDAGMTDGMFIRLDADSAAATGSDHVHEGTLFYIDPHGGGEFIEREQMVVRTRRMYGLPENYPEELLQNMLGSARNLQVWARVLANLRHVYQGKLGSERDANLSSRYNLLLLGILAFQQMLTKADNTLAGYSRQADEGVVSCFLRDLDANDKSSVAPNATTLAKAPRDLFLNSLGACVHAKNHDKLKRIVCPDIWEDRASTAQYLPEEPRFRIGQLVKRLGERSSVGVVNGFARSPVSDDPQYGGPWYTVLWNGHKCMVHQERSLGISFERSYALVVNHASLGRYFSKRVVPRRANPFYVPNALLRTVYGASLCMSESEDAPSSPTSDAALGENYQKTNAMRK